MLIYCFAVAVEPELTADRIPLFCVSFEEPAVGYLKAFVVSVGQAYLSCPFSEEPVVGCLKAFVVSVGQVYLSCLSSEEPAAGYLKAVVPAG